MSDISLLSLVQSTLVGNSDLVLIVRNPTTDPTTNTIQVGALASNIWSDIFTVNTPANSTALTVTGGTMFYDSNYLYIATSNNVVKRVALSTF